MERDAINVRWFCRLAPPRVDVDIAGALAARLWPELDWRLSTHAIGDIGVQLATIDHPIPILTMTAHDASRDERAFLGAGGAGGSRERALAQVLFELAQTRSVLNAYRPKRDKVITAASRTSEMTDFLDGTVYFGFRENTPRLDWYTQGRRAASVGKTFRDLGCPDEDEEYEAALRWLRKAGLNPVVIDLGSACWPGAHLVRVIIPEMTLGLRRRQPLSRPSPLLRAAAQPRAGRAPADLRRPQPRSDPLPLRSTEAKLPARRRTRRSLSANDFLAEVRNLSLDWPGKTVRLERNSLHDHWQQPASSQPAIAELYHENSKLFAGAGR